MLFFLTGEIQTGKTRWLSVLVEELETAGVQPSGVLAPGVWRERSDEEIAAGAERFEKLGIDNLLLPQHERIAFARRRDLAQEAGTYSPHSQSARAGLAWEIDDEAVTRVNAHFAQLAEGRAACAAGECDGPGAVNAVADQQAGADADASLLVVDELGRLELLRGEGLTEAMRLLEAGPSQRLPHALVVVRRGLLDEAHAAFDGIWDAVLEIAPDDEGRKAVFGAFGRE